MARTYPPSSRPMPAVPGVRHRTITARGLRFHVAEAGPEEGDPVLLVHGFPAHWYLWRRLIPLLDDHRLICLDLRGFGWSEGATHGWDIDDLTTDVLAVLDELGVDRTSIIGHDNGARVGFNACFRAPERFTSFVAANSAHPRLPRRVARLEAWRYWYTAVLEWPPIGRWMLRHVPAYTRFLIRRGMPGRFPDVVTEFAAAQREPGASRAGEGVNFEFVRHDILKHRLRRFAARQLSVPTTLLGGSDDVYVPQAFLRGDEQRADSLTTRVIRGVGHYLPLEAPEAIAAAARELSSRVHQ